MMVEPGEIRSAEELEAALEESAVRPVLLLKHSTRCHISVRVLDDVRGFARSVPPGDLSVYVVGVVESRALSRDIAARLGVRHESPQAILVRDRRVAWHDSHFGIGPETLREALDGLGRARPGGTL